jgi:uncharacterized protein YwgA
MTDDETHHPRLILLDEAEGRIEGRAKYHKLLFNYADEEADETALTFVREERGPYDPGLSQAIQRYMDLGLVDVEDDEEPHEVEQTQKGRRYMSGYERTKMRLDGSFRQTKERIRNTIKRHGDKSASEMVDEENVQDAKENPMRKELD